VLRKHDLVFLKHFSMVIGILVFVTVVLLVFAAYMHTKLPIEPNPAREAKIAERIAPMGAVYAGSTGQAAMAAAAEAAKAAAASQVAYGGTLDGSVHLRQPVHRLPYQRRQWRTQAGKGRLGCADHRRRRNP
jgi:hypothetical protein